MNYLCQQQHIQQRVHMQTCIQQQLRDKVLLIIRSLVGAAKKMKNQYPSKNRNILKLKLPNVCLPDEAALI
jgi:hypothetical protein